MRGPALLLVSKRITTESSVEPLNKSPPLEVLPKAKARRIARGLIRASIATRVRVILLLPRLVSRLVAALTCSYFEPQSHSHIKVWTLSTVYS